MANKIFVTGDTHGSVRFSPHGVDGYSFRLNTDSFPEQKGMNRDDFVLISGDFGAVWQFDPRYVPYDIRYIGQASGRLLPYGESPEERYWLDWLEARPFTTAAVAGNHENYDRIRYAYPHVDFRGGRAARLREHVYILDNGYMFNLGTADRPYMVFAMGGARSHDIYGGVLNPEWISDSSSSPKRAFSAEKKKLIKNGKPFRIRHLTWWDEEIPPREELERGLGTLKKHGWKADLILTHEVPETVFLKLKARYGIPAHPVYGNGRYMFRLYDENGEEFREYLEGVMAGADYSLWVSGHYHKNEEFHIKSKEFVLYEQIIRIR